MDKPRDNEMTTGLEQNFYRCEHCGTSNIVAVPVLYQEGTRTYSALFHRAVSQSQSAQAIAPPLPRRYRRPLLLWGFAIYFACFWAWAGFSALLNHPDHLSTLERPIAFLVFPGLACLVGLVLNLRRTSRYNRVIYPQLHWDWAHTYMCRRCGKLRLISPSSPHESPSSFAPVMNESR